MIKSMNKEEMSNYLQQNKRKTRTVVMISNNNFVQFPTESPLGRKRIIANLKKIVGSYRNIAQQDFYDDVEATINYNIK